jgi:hypothetical protein
MGATTAAKLALRGIQGVLAANTTAARVTANNVVAELDGAAATAPPPKALGVGPAWGSPDR